MGKENQQKSFIFRKKSISHFGHFCGFEKGYGFKGPKVLKTGALSGREPRKKYRSCRPLGKKPV